MKLKIKQKAQNGTKTRHNTPNGDWMATHMVPTMHSDKAETSVAQRFLL